MELPSNRSLVVEDAITGVEAALSANCKCLGITTSFTNEDLKKANWISKDLEEAPTDTINW